MNPADRKHDTTDSDPRVQFAAERTLLAWVRTGLAMMGFGFVVARFGLFMRELLSSRGMLATHQPGLSKWVGTALVALGVFVNIAAGVQHWRRTRLLAAGQPLRPRPLSLATLVAAVLALIGALMTLYLLRAG